MFSTKPARLDAVDAQIADAARQLPAPVVPPPLRQAALTAFQERGLPTRRAVPHRAFVGVAALVILAALAVFAPARLATAPVSASEITDAIHAANTWHLSGWRLNGDKKVRWDVWGRRQPFFYREQIGEEVVIDDGQKRLHLLPPQRMHPTGLLLIQPSHPLSTDKATDQSAYDSSAFLSGTSGDAADDFTITSGTANRIVLESQTVSSGYVTEQVRVTAHRETRLPLRYELTRSRYKWQSDGSRYGETPQKTWVRAALQAEYNLPVPPDVLREADALRAPRPDFRVVDFAAGPSVPVVTGTAIARKGGVTVACETLARDADGNLRLRYRVWLGDLGTSSSGSLLSAKVMPLCPPFTDPWKAHYPKDTLGNIYLALDAPDADISEANTAFRWGYFTIVHPLPDDAARNATTLTLPLRVQVSVSEEDAENGTRQRAIADETLTLTVPLPADVASLEYDRPRAEDVARFGSGPQFTLRFKTAKQRGDYWYLVGSGQTPTLNAPKDRQLYLRAKKEYLIAVDEAERIGVDGLIMQFTRENVTGMDKLLKQK